MSMMDYIDTTIPDEVVGQWGEPKLPYIPQGAYGKWTVSHKQPRLIRGYYSGLQVPEHDNLVLTDQDGEVWMSLTPMEIESQMPFIQAATGHVVVVGAGLGFYLINILGKDEVTEVTLIDRDQDILEMLFHALDGTGLWLDSGKLSTVKTDVFDIPNWTEEIDYLYVDIWQTLGSEQALRDTQRLVGQFKPKGVGYWGMEIDFVSWAGSEGYEPPPTEKHWREWVEWTGMPIQVPAGHEYLAYVAAQNVVNY